MRSSARISTASSRPGIAARRELFGYTADEAVGQSITMLIPPDRCGEEDMVLGRIRRGERVEHFDTIRWRKDGTLVDVSLTVSPIRDARARSSARRKSLANISDRKRDRSGAAELQHRLMGLAAASASILGSPDVDARAVGGDRVARDVFAADGYAMWRRRRSGAWRVVAIVWHLGRVRLARHRCRRRAIRRRRVPFSEPLICRRRGDGADDRRHARCVPRAKASRR